jgi:hypothetical protein
MGAGVSVGGVGGEDGNVARSICMIVLYKLESIEQEGEEQIARRQQQQHEHKHERQEQEGDKEEEERRRRRVELAQPRTPEPTGLGLSIHHHLPLEDDDEPHGHPSPPNWAIERLTTLSSQLKSAVELSSSLLRRVPSPRWNQRLFRWRRS